MIYSLIFASVRDFKDRTDGPIEIGPVKTRAEQLANGHVRITGAWMAGYHFNSALFQTSAVYRRILKTIDRRDASLKILLPLRQAAYAQKANLDWPNTNIEQVRAQVSYPEHDADGTYHARRVSYEQEVSPAEELIDLLEVTLQ